MAGSDVEWAAWAQAFLSAAAVWFSVKAVDRQHRLETYRERQKKVDDRNGRIGAVEAEIALCERQCRVYVDQYVRYEWRAPGYRLPLVAYESALPALLSEGALNQRQTQSVVQFYVDALSFNRGLDRLAQMQVDIPNFDRREPPQLYLDEAERTLVKALHLIAQDAPERRLVGPVLQSPESRVADAKSALSQARHAQPSAWWQRSV